jgi:hypothetical protein
MYSSMSFGLLPAAWMRVASAISVGIGSPQVECAKVNVASRCLSAMCVAMVQCAA